MFKAGDYSGPADDSKALNASSPAPTDAAGRYSVNVSYSGPVIVVVRPNSSGSTMCDEVTGICTVPFNFRMRTALASVAPNTTAHITPFTEMAAKAVGTSTNPDLIKTANTVVRTQVLAGLDPLTISPIVDSTEPTAQAFQKQMVVALAAVAQAANAGWVGNHDCSAATSTADVTACAVDALSNTVTNLSATSANIDSNNVSAFSDAVFKLGVIHIPTLNSNGSLDTSATMDTSDPAETEYWVLENNVAASSKYLADHVTPNSGGMTSTNNLPNGLPSTTTLNGVNQAKAFFSDLRTNLHLFVNGTNGLLDNQTARISDDLNSVIAANATNDMQLLKLMMSGAQVFTTGTPVTGSNFACALTFPTVTCLSRSAYAASGVTQNYLQVVLTSTGASSLTYTAVAIQCTADGTTTGVGCTGNSSPLYGKATGSGSANWTVDSSGQLTGLTLPAGSTFPGSTAGVYQDNVNLSGTLSVPAAGSQRIDVSGSVSSYDYDSTTAMASTTPWVTLALGSGSYATYTTSQNVFSYSNLSDANVILVASTPNTKFTGTLAMGNFKFDHSGTKWNPTTATFTGSIADTSTGGAGEFMTGKLEFSASNYASYNATQPESISNPHKLSTKYSGQIAFPGAQAMNVTLGINHLGLKTAFISANLSYGSGKTISVYSSPVDPTSSSNSITLTNQDGLLVTLTQGQNSVVRDALSETVATISHNMVNYSDGYVESLY